MFSTLSKYTLILALAIISLSLVAMGINLVFYQFPGNNFFPTDSWVVAILLVVFNLGLMLVFNKETYARQAGTETMLFLAIMSLIAFATNQIQLTPFTPIDKDIIRFESMFGFNMKDVLLWTQHHPSFKKLLAYTYDTLPYQMSFLPLLIILAGKFKLIREYYFLMLFTTLFGFLIYYFFPTTAPASMVNSPEFSIYQIATGLKFNQLHHHIQPTTNEGGLIAFPSFHVVWALLITYLMKDWAVLCLITAVINGLLILSCVLLGWHYPTDILGGVILVIIALYYLKKLNHTRRTDEFI